MTEKSVTAWFSPSGQIRVYLSEESEEVYMDADFGYGAAEMRDALSVIEGMGYMVVPPEECEPDIYEDYVRVYLTETRPQTGAWLVRGRCGFQVGMRRGGLVFA